MYQSKKRAGKLHPAPFFFGKKSEHAAHPHDSVHQRIDFLPRVVQAEGGADGAFDAQPLHQRLGTVVAGAHRNPQAVEQCSHVEVMNVAHEEGDDAAFLGRFSEDAHAGHLPQALHGVGGEVVFVGGNAVHAQGGDVVQGTRQGGCADVVGRSGFEFEGQFVEGRALEADVLYHLPAALVGRKPVQPVLFAVENAHSGRPVDLMTREDIEVCIEVLHVNGHVGDALSAVHQDGYAVAVRRANHLFDGVYGAQHVAYVRHADQSGTLGEQLAVGIEEQFAAVVHGNHLEHDALPRLQKLPRDDVAVVFHGGKQDLVAGLEAGFSVAVGQEVDAFSGAAGEDNLVCRAGIDEAAHGFAACFVQFRGPLGQEMDATVHVCVDAVVLFRDGFYDRAGLLCRGSVVQIYEGFAVHGAAEDRKVVPYAVHLIRDRGLLFCHFQLSILHYPLQMAHPWHLFSSPRKRFSTSRCRRSRSASRRMVSITSPRKANISSMRASFRGMPRCCM